MAQWLGAMTDLPEILSSIPRIHREAHNHLLPSSGVLEVTYNVLVYIKEIIL